MPPLTLRPAFNRAATAQPLRLSRPTPRLVPRPARGHDMLRAPSPGGRTRPAVVRLQVRQTLRTTGVAQVTPSSRPRTPLRSAFARAARSRLD